MAARKRKARPRRSAVVIVNRPKHRSSTRRRRHYRHNPRLSVGHVAGMVGSGIVRGAVIVGTEAGTRLIRGRVLNMTAGTLLSGATEIGISTAAGVIAGHFLGESIGQLIVDAGFASVYRATAKQLKAPWIADALADDAHRANYVVRGGRAYRRPDRMGGYVAGSSQMNGYVRGRQPLGMYVGGQGSAVDDANMASVVSSNNHAGV